jgi:hypothetical protein
MEEVRLTKQSIRRGVTINDRTKNLTKDEIITLSEKWTEKEIIFFKKMLKQGGYFNIQGNKFHITVPELIYNSKGDVEATLQEHEHED